MFNILIKSKKVIILEIRENKIQREILDTVSQPLVPMENYVRSRE